jgi:hypothetical protein
MNQCFGVILVPLPEKAVFKAMKNTEAARRTLTSIQRIIQEAGTGLSSHSSEPYAIVPRSL